MVVDTSALIAILNNEPERNRFLSALEMADRCYISALTLYETQIVALARLGADGERELTQLIDEFEFWFVPFDRGQADLATAAYRQFGKGVGTPGVLNFGDCAAYMLSKSLNLPLLYKGADFSATDVILAA